MSIEVRVNGVNYGGWKSARVSRGVENIAGTFRVSVSDLWPDAGEVPAISAFDACEVLVDGETVLTGYIEKVTPSYDKDSHSISFSGSSKTGDLVDCAAIKGEGQMVGVTILEVAQALCEPFGITASADVDVGDAIANFQISPGDTVFECLAKHAKVRGLYLTDDASGNLLITKSGSTKASGRIIGKLQNDDNNVLSGRGEIDVSRRFSEYRSKGTTQRFALEDAGTENATGTATDSDVPRYRPTVVNSEGNSNGTVTQKRADWEASNRLARSMKYVYRVQGWRQTPGGSLWVPNQIVPVVDDVLKIDGSFLISTVEYAVSDRGGSTTSLHLVPPGAFEPAPTVSASSSGSSSRFVLAPE